LTEDCGLIEFRGRIFDSSQTMLEELCFGLAASILISTLGSFVTENWFLYLMSALVLFEVCILFSGTLRNPNFAEREDAGDSDFQRTEHCYFKKRKGKNSKEQLGIFDKIKNRIHADKHTAT
jgi:hypothetical protein